MGLGTKINIIEVDYNEVENLVMEKYPWATKYDFPCMQETSNDTSHTFDIDGELDEYDLKDWEELKKNNGYLNYRNSLILNKLCADGHIEPGEYLVNVSW